MATTLPYYEQKDIENIKKLREMTKTLPPFCTEGWESLRHFPQLFYILNIFLFVIG